jgi:cation transport ATPase
VILLAGNVPSESLNLLQLAGSVEAKSEHPLAAAIVAEVKRRGLLLFDCTGFQSISGKAASGIAGGRRIVVGSIPYFQALGGYLMPL